MSRGGKQLATNFLMNTENVKSMNGIFVIFLKLYFFTFVPGITTLCLGMKKIVGSPGEINL